VIPVQFVFVAAALSGVGLTSYVVATLRGTARPNRVTWFLWSLAPLIAFAAELSQGVGLQSLMTFVVGFGPAVVLAASFVSRHGSVRLTRFDLSCGSLSLVALAMWRITGQGDVAIAFSVAADLLAGVPTIRKAYRDPASESWPAFACSGLSAAITLLTITTWTFAAAAFPVYILCGSTLLTVLIRFPSLGRASAASGAEVVDGPR
jgi:hypothetical protein